MVAFRKKCKITKFSNFTNFLIKLAVIMKIILKKLNIFTKLHFSD